LGKSKVLPTSKKMNLNLGMEGYYATKVGSARPRGLAGLAAG
jgi:hypothetical protein